MKVYVMQHARAVLGERDSDRLVADRGRRATDEVADVVAGLGVSVEQIWHSNKTRARQTAEIMADAIVVTRGVVAVSGLAPLDDVEAIGQELNKTSHPTLFVGHLPFLECLVGWLLTGDASQAVTNFTNSGMVCLAKNGEHWQAVWILTPQIAEAMIRC